MPNGTPGGSPLRVIRALRLGLPVRDRDFDAFLPADVRRMSRRFWTPLEVVQIVVDWLRPEPVERVVDVGSGAGKLCVAAALGSACHFTGIEHRERLHDASVALAERMEVTDQTAFVLGSVGSIDIAGFDAMYLFNPFGENTFAPEEQIDHDVELGEARFHQDVETVERALERMRPGAVLFTYHGFGGRIPDSFSLARSENAGTDIVRMWRKTLPPRGGAWLELDEGVVYRPSAGVR
jgi:predicted RNA methylase